MVFILDNVTISTWMEIKNLGIWIELWYTRRLYYGKRMVHALGTLMPRVGGPY